MTTPDINGTAQERRAAVHQVRAQLAQDAERKRYRTIHIRTPMEMGLYGELLQLIGQRWPGATLTTDGIYIPEEEA